MSRKVTTCLLLSVALSLAPISWARARTIQFDVISERLENGLEILLVEDHSVPAVSYYTFFRVGSRNERPGRTGISHLFGHMMFNGSRNFPAGEFDRLLESRGGFNNAFTAEEEP